MPARLVMGLGNGPLLCFGSNVGGFEETGILEKEIGRCEV